MQSVYLCTSNAHGKSQSGAESFLACEHSFRSEIRWNLRPQLNNISGVRGPIQQPSISLDIFNAPFILSLFVPSAFKNIWFGFNIQSGSGSCVCGFVVSLFVIAAK